MGDEELVLQGHLLVIIGLLQKKRSCCRESHIEKREFGSEKFYRKGKHWVIIILWYKSSDFMTANTFLGKSDM